MRVVFKNDKTIKRKINPSELTGVMMNKKIGGIVLGFLVVAVWYSLPIACYGTIACIDSENIGMMSDGGLAKISNAIPLAGIAIVALSWFEQYQARLIAASVGFLTSFLLYARYVGHESSLYRRVAEIVSPYPLMVILALIAITSFIGMRRAKKSANAATGN